jgi:glycosyltransferase involved in cell wall biosynthesis
MRCAPAELPPPPSGKTGWPWTFETPQVRDILLDGSLWPRVSIVTPSLNQGQFIEETIRSVLLQGYPNLEYIVIDGGSSDQSVEIIKKYEKQIAFWTSSKDGGQSEAINKGLRRATGDIYGWINSDDWLAPGTLWEAAKAYQMCMEKNRFWILSSVECIDDRSGQRTILKHPPINDLDDWLVDRIYINQPGAFWSSSITKEIGYLEESLHLGMDAEYFMRMVAHGYRMVCVDRIGAKFRLHASSKSTTKSEYWGYDCALAKRWHLPRDHPNYNALRREFDDSLIYFLVRFAQNEQVSARARFAYLARAVFIHPRALARRDFLSTLRRVVLNYTKDS